MLLKHNERMLKMQELQTSRILQLERKIGHSKENREENRDNRDNRDNRESRERRERRREGPVDILDSSDEDKGVGRGYIEDELMQRRTVPSKPNKSMSYNKGSKYSVAKGKQDYSRSKRESLLKSREAKESDNNLSEYDSSNNERSFQSEKCT